MSAAATAQQAKGSTLRSTLDFLAAEVGPDAVERVLASLPPADRRVVETAAATDEVPLEVLIALLRATDRAVGAEHPEWVERSGAFAIQSFGVKLYGGILRKASPTEFLTQRVSLFQLYYRPGNMEVVEAEGGRAVLRLVGFDPVDVLFCRRQTGGLLRSVELAGGRSGSVRHVRCSAEGDAFCEWELRWS
ncbi:MAG TPA: hypothetical protein VHG51_21335 [Longimicrobiaceae bacterium]|nr:hypothetical protein [Longimicrobiaceae bacterium]